ncbi:unnamed protein product [Phaeothamnion confervicola]
MVLVGVGNKVLQKLETIPMYNYPNFLNLFTTFAYIPFSFAYIIPMVRYGTAITPEQRAVPKRVFVVMAILDGIGGIMQILCATYLNGALLILLSQAIHVTPVLSHCLQASIPISMAVSSKLLGARYSASQLFGALVVAAGIVTVLGPSLAGQRSSSGDGGGSDGSGVAGWAAVMVASCVPISLSTVYKEVALGESELDPVYLNGWVAVFQFIVSLPLALPAALASDPRVTPAELPRNVWNGLLCYLGQDSVMGRAHPDRCWPQAPVFVTSYICFNVCYNVLIILLIKFGSATALFLALTVTVPLGNLIFALPGVPGRTEMRAADITGLFVIMAGLVFYRFGDAVWPAGVVGGRFLGRFGGKRGGGAAGENERTMRQPLLSLDAADGDGEIESAAAAIGNGGAATQSSKKATMGGVQEYEM